MRVQENSPYTLQRESSLANRILYDVGKIHQDVGAFGHASSETVAHCDAVVTAGLFSTSPLFFGDDFLLTHSSCVSVCFCTRKRESSRVKDII